MTDGAWTLVGAKRKGRKTKRVILKAAPAPKNQQIASRAALVEHIATLPINNCICLGLGSLKTNASREQYALLLLIKNKLNVPVGIYDPAFTTADLADFAKNSITLISDLKGGYQTATRTLFYAPHCSEAIYNNILASNWRNLSDVVIFGNSFQFYGDSLNERVLRSKAPLIHWCLGLGLEVGYNEGDGDVVFNNSSLIVFEEGRLKGQTKSFWDDAPIDLQNISC